MLYGDATWKSGWEFGEDKSKISSTTDKHEEFTKIKVKLSLYSILRQRPAWGVEV
jgi:hypothetical protein